MQRLRVAVGVVLDGDDRVLIARRAAHRHQGGLWEFPGGKVEAGETAREALVRELREEVGITVHAADAWLEVSFDYPDRQVTLEVFRVHRFAGEAEGLEGQRVQWVAVSALGEYDFPEANGPIVEAMSGGFGEAAS